MKNGYILIAVILALCGPAASATDKAGLFSSGGNAGNLGRGGTGVSSEGGDSWQINPAGIALMERLSFGINYGSIGGKYVYPYTTFIMPGEYGVFAAGFGYYSIPGSAPGMKDYAVSMLSGKGETSANLKGYTASIGMGKDITSRLLFGLSFEGAYSDYNGSSYYAGIRPGLIYRFDGMEKYSGFGFFSPAIGLSADMGFPSGKGSNLNSAAAGYSFGFFRNEFFKFTLYNDYSAVSRFKRFPVKMGLQWDILNDLHLRGGVVLPDSYGYMSYTSGAGYSFTGSSFAGSLNYAFVYSKDNHASHYAGITLEYGSLDRESPVTTIVPDYSWISPNNDGIQDSVTFSIEVRDESSIKGWRLQITDDEDNVVREFKISERDIENNITPAGFVDRFISRKDSLNVPGRIQWDGTDSSGKKLADGRYRYYFYAWDSRDNIAPVKSGTVIIKCTPPAIRLKTGSLVFSPNGDGNKDIFVIHQEVITDPDDTWNACIKNADGVEVISYKWDGTDVPGKFTWDGKDAKGDLLPDGLYYYSISSADKAGNRVSASVNEITLTTAIEVADVKPSSEYFSYRSPGELKMRFFPELTSVKWLERWELTISDAGGDPVRIIAGTGKLPGFIDWDCIDSKGEKLKDGVYSVKFAAWYTSGNNPVSFSKKIIFNSTQPVVSIVHSPSLFSPDGDGINDVLSIEPSVKVSLDIAKWEIDIFNESGLLFKKITGTGTPPSVLNWNGIGDNGELVESASDYEIHFTAVDKAGNVSETAKDRFPVDVLVVVTERGLKIRISNIEFAFGSANIKKRGEDILNRVYQILEKYGHYNIVIEGHTDDVGSEEFNLKLSEKRALSVRDYLVWKGTKTGRLRYIGMGNSMPFYPNTNDENRRRNRRVEFLLIKEKTVQ